jgi:hypothetical protein
LRTSATARNAAASAAFVAAPRPRITVQVPPMTPVAAVQTKIGARKNARPASTATVAMAKVVTEALLGLR